jgi:transcription termination factor Rho
MVHPTDLFMHLKELKSKNPADLVSMAEELGVEGASTLRKQDLMFAILKELAADKKIQENSFSKHVSKTSFFCKI